MSGIGRKIFRRLSRKRYQDDYAVGEGGVAYVGKTYRYAAQGRALRRMKAAYLLFALAAAAFYGAAGFVRAAGSRILYVALPYAGLFLPVALMLYHGFGVAALGDTLTRRQAEGTVGGLRRSALAAAVLAGLTAAGDLALIMGGPGPGQAGNEWGFWGACAALAALSAGFYRFQRRYQLVIIENLNNN